MGLNQTYTPVMKRLVSPEIPGQDIGKLMMRELTMQIGSRGLVIPRWWLGIGLLFFSLLLLVLPAARGQDVEALATTAAARAVPAARQATNLAVITIEGEIDNVTTASIERRLAEAALAGADGVVFEINTFGGLATAALEICEVIKSSPIPKTLAWVRPKAYSAGTFIALACDEMVISPNGTIGDCAPILPFLIPIPAAERAKVESPLLEEVMDSAAQKYDYRLCISFVATDMELWFVRNTETGRERFVDRKDYIFLFGEDPPEDARMRGSGGIVSGDGSAGKRNEMLERFIAPGRGGRPGGVAADDSAPLKTMSERIAEAADQLPVPPVALPFTESDRGKYELLEPVVNSQTLLVLKTPRALRYGIAKETIANDQELMAFMGASTLTRYNRNWSESLVRVLTSMPIRVMLVIIFAIGLIWEMATPGVGMPGAFAGGALVILLGAPALTGMAQWWDILFVLAGILLIAAELLVIPGFGIAGVAGIVLLALGFVGTFIAPDPGGGLLPASPGAQAQGLRGLFTLLVAFFASGVGIYFISRHLQTMPFFRQLVLSKSVATVGAPTSMLGAMADRSADLPKVGACGEAITSLRPSGRGRINGAIYDVVSGRGVVDPGERIVVKSADEFSIVVEILSAENEVVDGD